MRAAIPLFISPGYLSIMQCILVSRLHTLRPISNSICAAQRCLFNDYKTCPNPKTYQVQNSGTPLLFYRPQSSLLKAWGKSTSTI